MLREMNDQNKVVIYDGSSVTSPKNWNNPHPGDPCYALHTDSRNYVVISLEGNGARPSHMGKGFSEDGTMYTLNTIEQHSVCYENSHVCGGGHCVMKDRTAAQTTRLHSQSKQADRTTIISQPCATYSVDCRNLNTNREVSGTLQAKDNGGFSYNYLNPVLMENDQ